MKLMLINNLFEGEQRSHVLDKLALVDPIQWTNPEDEERIVSYHITNNTSVELMEDLVDLEWEYISYLVDTLQVIVREGV